MDTRTCWAFDSETKEFIGETTAFPDPLDGGFNLPQNATFVEPPDVEEFEISVWNGTSWDIVPDYRQHLVDGEYVGGKQYYDPSDYWWAIGMYMQTYGDIPSGMSFTKMPVPQMVHDENDADDEINEYRQYLVSTDYIDNVLAEEPEKADKYASVVAERKRVRALIDPKTEERDSLRAQIVDLYGEDALAHLRYIND